MTPPPPILLTGFEPYGGLASNPSLEAMRRLDGAVIGGRRVVGRVLPVVLGRLAPAIAGMLAEVAPAAVVSLGLSPGEAVVRIERIAVNLADFDLPDNDGRTHRDAPLHADGAAALFATLPLRAIERACNAAGIPARISNSAGSYLCNACLYRFLAAAAATGAPMPCGFLHVPHTPEEIAERLSRAAVAVAVAAAAPELASMDLDRIVGAAEIAIMETVKVLERCEATA